MSATRPSADQFTIDVVPDRERVTVVPRGDLDVGSAAALEYEVRELRQSGFDLLAVDLSQVSFIDSVALRVLISLRNDAKRDGHHLELMPGPPHVQRIFDITVTRGLFDWKAR
jgi:anti-anti-sigma factor